jgi:PmbA protein
MKHKKDTLSLAKDAVKDALKRGCDEAEAFIKTTKSLSVEVKNSALDALESSDDFGMSLRVIKNNRLGFSFSTNPGEVENMIDDAVNGALWTAPDEFTGLPQAKPPFPVQIFDERLKQMHEDDVIRNTFLLEKNTLDYDKRIKKVRKAEISLATGNTTILNSKGVEISYDSSYIAASVTAYADDGSDTQTGWDFDISRRFSDINLSAVAHGASKRALVLLGSRKIASVRAPVILESSVAADFLGILSTAISAEAVQKKRSFLEGKVGKKIMPPRINIFDNAHLPWKIGTRPVDDEGVPTLLKAIVFGGVLQGYIHNTYTAKKDGIVSTGNASRGSFKSLPGIDVTNFYIEPEKQNTQETRSRNYNDLIKSLSRGLVILETMGIHTANPVTGEFSIGISGLWIENNEIAYPIKEAIMSGTILELFQKVEYTGTDLRFYGNIGSPSLLIGEMDISA